MKLINFLVPGVSFVAVLVGSYQLLKLLEDPESSNWAYFIVWALVLVNASFFVRFCKEPVRNGKR